MGEEWMTTAEAAEQLNVSERYVRNLALKGKLKAKRDGNRWLIHSSLSEPDEEPSGIPDGIPTEQGGTQAEQPTIEWFQKRIEEQEKQILDLQSELASTRKASEDAGERHDMIVMQLTKQLGESQKLLEYHESPWWRRWFGKRRRPPDDMGSD
jgi:excisionase family DNA binding protein